MISWMRRDLTVSGKLLASILVLGVVAVVFAIGLMFVAGYLISASADGVFSILMLNIPLAFVQIFGLGKPIARYFERLRSHDWVLRLTSAMRHQLFVLVQRRHREGGERRTGEVLGSLASDIEHVQNLYLRTVFPVLIAWLSGLLLVIVAGCCSLSLFVFALGMMVLLCLVLPALSILIGRARILRLNDDRARLYADVTDMVMGAQDVAIAGRGDRESTRFIREFERERATQRTNERIDRVRLLTIQVLLLVALLVILWWTTQRFGGVVGGSADWIVAVALGFFPIIEVLAPLSKQFEEGLSHRESLERLRTEGLLDVPTASAFAAPKPRGALDITMTRLEFHYDPSHEILRALSIEVPYGQHVAVLGKSGSGKTTLARLLHGDIEAVAGSIDIGGVPVGELRSIIWDYLGLISQDSYVFAMTIMDNLRIGKMGVTETQAWAALEAVGLKEHVESLPEKLETMADEAGLNFSGGQRQRLALARVLLQDPPIIVLDEPTVGLDPITEEKVLDTIMRLFADKTVVMVTHHLQGVDQFDRVLFLEDGMLVMDGSPQRLAQEDERYRKLLAFDKGFFS